MKNTKYLFDEGKQTPEGMVSVSQLQSFMSCGKKWEYGYIENLTPRVERPYLSIGKLCHKGMQTCMEHMWNHCHDVNYSSGDSLGVALVCMTAEWQEYIRNNCFLAEEMPDQEKILEDAKSVFSQAFWELGIDGYEVQTVYKNGAALPALELHFAVPCAGSKGMHGYIDAILKDKKTGFVWCVDYKFRKSLSDDSEEAFNVQNAVYTHACSKMGIDTGGTMTWQHINTPAADPAVLKNGSISRAKIKTTWSHYHDFCVGCGVDPEPYREEMVEKLADIEWFRPTYEYRNEDTVKRIWNEVVVPASRAVKSAHKKSNRRSMYPWNCKMCQFKGLCQAELRGYDAAAIRGNDFVKRSHGGVDKNILDEGAVTVV